MAAHVWPVDNVSDTGRALRQALGTGLTMFDPNRPLGGVSGVRPGTKASIGSVTSTQWTVNPFGGTLDGEALAIAGTYQYAFDAAVSGGVNPSGAAARTDRLDVQILDPAEGDGSGTPGVQVVYTPSGGAVPARSHPLFLINVPATGGGSPTLTWNATFTASAGGVLDFLTLSALQAWTPPKDGQLAYAYDTDNTWQYLAGAAPAGWYHVSGRPVIAAFTPTGLYSNAAPMPEVAQQAGRNYLEGVVASSSASFVAGTTYTIGSIPAAFAPAANQVFACLSNVTALAQVTVTSTGSVAIVLNTSFTGALNLSLAGCSWRVKGL